MTSKGSDKVKFLRYSGQPIRESEFKRLKVSNNGKQIREVKRTRKADFKSYRIGHIFCSQPVPSLDKGGGLP